MKKVRRTIFFLAIISGAFLILPKESFGQYSSPAYNGGTYINQRIRDRMIARRMAARRKAARKPERRKAVRRTRRIAAAGSLSNKQRQVEVFRGRKGEIV